MSSGPKRSKSRSRSRSPSGQSSQQRRRSRSRSWSRTRSVQHAPRSRSRSRSKSKSTKRKSKSKSKSRSRSRSRSKGGRGKSKRRSRSSSSNRYSSSRTPSAFRRSTSPQRIAHNAARETRVAEMINPVVIASGRGTSIADLARCKQSAFDADSNAPSTAELEQELGLKGTKPELCDALKTKVAITRAISGGAGADVGALARDLYDEEDEDDYEGDEEEEEEEELEARWAGSRSLQDASLRLREAVARSRGASVAPIITPVGPGVMISTNPQVVWLAGAPTAGTTGTGIIAATPTLAATLTNEYLVGTRRGAMVAFRVLKQTDMLGFANANEDRKGDLDNIRTQTQQLYSQLRAQFQDTPPRPSSEAVLRTLATIEPKYKSVELVRGGDVRALGTFLGGAPVFWVPDGKDQLVELTPDLSTVIDEFEIKGSSVWVADRRPKDDNYLHGVMTLSRAAAARVAQNITAMYVAYRWAIDIIFGSAMVPTNLRWPSPGDVGGFHPMIAYAQETDFSSKVRGVQFQVAEIMRTFLYWNVFRVLSTITQGEWQGAGSVKPPFDDQWVGQAAVRSLVKFIGTGGLHPTDVEGSPVDWKALSEYDLVLPGITNLAVQINPSTVWETSGAVLETLHKLCIFLHPGNTNFQFAPKIVHRATADKTGAV